MYDRIDVTDSLDGKTVSAVLRQLRSKSSWGDVERLIKRRHVEVSGNLCLDPARRVRAGEPIKIWENPLPREVTADDISILFVDGDIVVFTKPARITSVRHKRESRLSKKRRQLQPTIDELLPHAMLRHFGVIPRRNAQLTLPQIYPVHRLDRDTSGIMLAARTKIAETKLVEMFRHHRIDRRYLAVVGGSVESQTFESNLVRDRGDGLRGSQRQSGDDTLSETKQLSQHAVTHIRVVQQFTEATLIECRLETGRTHQIRIHLSEADHPIAGERMYTRDVSNRPIKNQIDAPRQVLHAHAARFTHPLTNETIQLKTEWPDDLKAWLSELK